MAKGQKKQAQSKINKDQFEAMCKIQCTETEIALIFGVSHDTINRWCHQEYGLDFANTYKKFRSFGNLSLRKSQFELAKRNPTMAIWLGKQYLNQREYGDENGSEMEDDPLTRSIKESLDNVK